MDERTTPAPEPPVSPDPSAPAATSESPKSDAPEAETTQAFAELLATSGEQPGPRWKRGEKIQAVVVRVTEEWVFVSLGTKEEGAIRRAEFTAAEGEATTEGSARLPAEGETIEAYVLSTQGGEVVLTTKLARRDSSKAALEEAWRSGIPVEGRVTQAVKGGLEVRVSGLRAFCPLSQIDVRWPKQPEAYVGQTYTFRILEFKEKGRNVIVSRRALLEEERARQREGLRESVVPGAVLSGLVRSIQSFGAFVDLGGLDALIPVSEMSWQRVGSPAEVLSEGQTVTAKVLTVDWEKDRVSLSLKALEEDPWAAAARKFEVGQRVTGTVARLAPFGAFVTLEPGIDGLVHISALGAGRRVGHPKEVLQPGETVEVEVLGVDRENRKISLSMGFRHADSVGSLPRSGEILGGVVERVMEFGVLVKIPSGHTGLVPNVEMGTPRGTDHAKSFKPGDPMEVVVLGVEEGGRKIRLSRRGVVRKREEDDLKEYSASQPENQGGSTFGTLGDLLKAKLGNR
ncbi:MAG: 30S ribosomal protein S1 [Deltaproteobacteria bacterium]|nr:30S ribosomal protein S1 [Deltaproteobacteria bacterium]